LLILKREGVHATFLFLKAKMGLSICLFAERLGNFFLALDDDIGWFKLMRYGRLCSVAFKFFRLPPALISVCERFALRLLI
jgi:hypothetical protein